MRADADSFTLSASARFNVIAPALQEILDILFLKPLAGLDDLLPAYDIQLA